MNSSHFKNIGARNLGHPNGIVASSPRLPSRRGYLGSRCRNGFNRNAVVADVVRDGREQNGRNRVAVGNFLRMLTQGSSCLATGAPWHCDRFSPSPPFGMEERAGERRCPSAISRCGPSQAKLPLSPTLSPLVPRRARESESGCEDHRVKVRPLATLGFGTKSRWDSAVALFR
jgi:hypothetical protein